MQLSIKRKLIKVIRYIFILFCVCFIIANFFIVYDYLDIPQLSIEKYSQLSIGDTGENNSLSITLIDSKLSDFDGGRKPPEGARYIFVKIKVTNIGPVRVSSDAVTKDKVKLYYAGHEMEQLYSVKEYSPTWSSYGAQYPGVTKEGWIGFEVPVMIDPSKTTLEIHGLKWNLEGTTLTKSGIKSGIVVWG